METKGQGVGINGQDRVGIGDCDGGLRGRVLGLMVRVGWGEEICLR